MAIIKRYVTWNRFIVHPMFRVDPSDAISHLWSKIKFTETDIGNQPDDRRFIGMVEYDDAEVSVEAFDRFIKNFAYHCFSEVTPEKTLRLCNRWYPKKETDETDLFELDTDNFTLVDKRPVGMIPKAEPDKPMVK